MLVRSALGVSLPRPFTVVPCWRHLLDLSGGLVICICGPPPRPHHNAEDTLQHEDEDHDGADSKYASRQRREEP